MCSKHRKGTVGFAVSNQDNAFIAEQHAMIGEILLLWPRPF